MAEEELSIEGLYQQVTALKDRISYLEDVALQDEQFDNQLKMVVDAQAKEIIELQRDAIEKEKKLGGITRWLVVLALGIFSLTTRYDVRFTKTGGIEVYPRDEVGILIPTAYALTIIAVATGNDRAVGQLLQKFGDRMNGKS